MELSTKNRKRKSRIAIIVVAVLVLAAFVFKYRYDNRREYDSQWYKKEQERFAEILNRASDEELFVVLNYAIAHHYVPNRDIDPYHDIHVMVGCWQRSLKVYEKLSDRKDLLRKVYPDLDVLDKYVHWGRQSGEPYPDTIVSKTILDNVKEGSCKMDSEMIEKYYETPFMR